VNGASRDHFVPTDEIDAQIARFPSWHYEFDLRGHRAPKDGLGANRNRQEQRARYVFEPLRRAFGGSLSGKRVLDLGCNAGYFALGAVSLGCDFVLGLDARQFHVEQANFVFAAKEIERSRYRFKAQDVDDIDIGSEGPFEIVLCLGLLYHVSDPAGLVERIARINPQVLVVDTTLLPLPGSVLQLRREQPDDPRFAAREQFVAIPTRRAVESIAEAAGYSVAALAPRFSDYQAAEDYRAGRRRAFFCTKEPRLLESVEEHVEDTSAARTAWTSARWGLHLAGEALRARTPRRPGLTGQPGTEARSRSSISPTSWRP